MDRLVLSCSPIISHGGSLLLRIPTGNLVPGLSHCETTQRCGLNCADSDKKSNGTSDQSFSSNLGTSFSAFLSFDVDLPAG